jgi:DNA-binding YbaB/EbfC family protein
MFEGLSNLGGLMKQAMQMKQRMAEVQAELAQQMHEASSGGGVVTAKVNGRGELIDIKIKPEAVQAGDVELLEELVKSAVVAASRKAQDAAKEAFGQVTGGLNLPGLEGLLGK